MATIALLAGAGVAQADTYRVTRTNDPTPGKCKPRDCSLREAVLEANSHPGGDTVIVKGGKTYDLEIEGRDENDGKTGDLDVHGKLTLRASKGPVATIDGNERDRVLDATKALTLERLRIIGGFAEAADGGGIRAAAPLRIVRGRILGNQADFNGGGIQSFGGMLRLLRTKLTGNSVPPSAAGGGGFIADDAAIARSRITGNEAASCAGGLVLNSGPTVTDSVFHENHATQSGGGLCASFAPGLKIADSRFTGNSANTGGSGGLSLSDATGLITRTTVQGNIAADGGAGISASRADLVISRSTISGNLASDAVTGTGGGIIVRGVGFDGKGVELVNSTVALNEAAAGGGGVYSTGTMLTGEGRVRLAFTTIVGNDGDSDGAGGDIGGGILEGMNSNFDDIHGTLIALNEADTEPDCAVIDVGSSGHNLFSSSDGCTVTDTDVVDSEPMLGTLGPHGGPTETIPLLADSPAIDRGGRQGPRIDQRGVKRPQGRRLDIGSFERRQ